MINQKEQALEGHGSFLFADYKGSPRWSAQLQTSGFNQAEGDEFHPGAQNFLEALNI